MGNLTGADIAVGRIGRRVSEGWVAALASGLILVHLALRGWWVSGAYFYTDDFTLIDRAFDQPLSWAYLVQGDAGHVSPGRALMFWLGVAVGPYERWPVVVITLALHAVAAVLFWRLMQRLFGTTLGALVPLTLYLFWAMTISTTLWWCAALLWLPLHIALIGALLAQVRYLETRRRRDGLLVGLATAFGLAFFEKALIIPIVLFAFTALYAGRGALWRRTGQALRAYWFGWALLVVICGAYIAAYFSVTTVKNVSGNPSLGDIAKLTHTLIVKAFGTEIWGGPWSWYPTTMSFATPPVAAIWVTAVLSVTVVVLSGFTGRRSWRAWSMLVGYLLIGIALMAVARSKDTGLLVLIGLNDRYISDVAAMGALAVGLAFLPLRGLGAEEPEVSSSPRALRRWVDRYPRGARIAVGAVVAAVAISSSISAARLQRHSVDTPTEKYLATLFADLKKDPQPIMFDGPVPEQVVAAIVEPANKLSVLLRSSPDAPFFKEWAHTFQMVDETGHLRPGTVTTGIRSRPVRPGTCPWVAKGSSPNGPATGVDVLLERGAAPARWIAHVAYAASEATPATVTFGRSTVRVELRAGLNNIYVAVADMGGAIHIDDLAPGASMCVSAAILGTASPKT